MNGLTIVPVNITEARAFVAAVDALIASVGGEYPGDRETDARDALLAAHAEAVAAAEARGRAAALAEVDAACEVLADASGECGTSPHSLKVFALERDSWGHGAEWTIEGEVLHAPTLTAAILAAAAALGGDA